MDYSRRSKLWKLTGIVLMSLASSKVKATIEDDFTRDDIIPDVISSPPKDMLKVTYANDVSLGEKLSPGNAAEIPKVICPAAAPGQLYTVAMVDPDAPYRRKPTYAQWLHWLLTNVPGEELASGSELTGSVGTKYSGPAPPATTGEHRYVLLVYGQAGDVEPFRREKWNGRLTDRAKFNITEFAEDNLLSGPECAFYFVSEHD